MIITWVILCILSATFIYGWCYYDTRDRWMAFIACLPGIFFGIFGLLTLILVFRVVEGEIGFKGLKYRG